jgi:hypothetical protein
MLAQRAAKYLERIATLTGAKPVYGDSYVLTSGRRHFLVDYKSVRVISRSGQSTCFYIEAVPDMPRAELIASALLQLKNNPRLFKMWRKQRGDLFKADGRIFPRYITVRRMNRTDRHRIAKGRATAML